MEPNHLNDDAWYEVGSWLQPHHLCRLWLTGAKQMMQLITKKDTTRAGFNADLSKYVPFELDSMHYAYNNRTSKRLKQATSWIISNLLPQAKSAWFAPTTAVCRAIQEGAMQNLTRLFLSDDVVVEAPSIRMLNAKNLPNLTCLTAWTTTSTLETTSSHEIIFPPNMTVLNLSIGQYDFPINEVVRAINKLEHLTDLELRLSPTRNITADLWMAPEYESLPSSLTRLALPKGTTFSAIMTAERMETLSKTLQTLELPDSNIKSSWLSQFYALERLSVFDLIFDNDLPQLTLVNGLPKSLTWIENRSGCSLDHFESVRDDRSSEACLRVIAALPRTLRHINLRLFIGAYMNSKDGRAALDEAVSFLPDALDTESIGFIFGESDTMKYAWVRDEQVNKIGMKNVHALIKRHGLGACHKSAYSFRWLTLDDLIKTESSFLTPRDAFDLCIALRRLNSTMACRGVVNIEKVKDRQTRIDPIIAPLVESVCMRFAALDLIPLLQNLQEMEIHTDCKQVSLILAKIGETKSVRPKRITIVFSTAVPETEAGECISGPDAANEVWMRQCLDYMVVQICGNFKRARFLEKDTLFAGTGLVEIYRFVEPWDKRIVLRPYFGHAKRTTVESVLSIRNE